MFQVSVSTPGAGAAHDTGRRQGDDVHAGELLLPEQFGDRLGQAQVRGHVNTVRNHGDPSCRYPEQLVHLVLSCPGDGAVVDPFNGLRQQAPGVAAVLVHVVDGIAEREVMRPGDDARTPKTLGLVGLGCRCDLV